MVSKKTFFSISLVGFWSLLTSQTNIFFPRVFLVFGVGWLQTGYHQETKNPKNNLLKQNSWFQGKKNEKWFFGFPGVFLVSFGFLERVFGFLVLDAEKQKKTSFFGFWSLLTSKANIFLEFFWFLELATSGNQRKQTPFRGNPKKPKKLQGNQRIKTFPWNQEFKFCSKMFFFVFWFLGGIRMIIFKGYTCYSRYVSHYLKPKYTETYRWMDGLVDCLNIRSILYIYMYIYIYLSIWYTYIHTYIYIYIFDIHIHYTYIYIYIDRHRNFMTISHSFIAWRPSPCWAAHGWHPMKWLRMWPWWRWRPGTFSNHLVDEESLGRWGPPVPARVQLVYTWLN